MKRPMFASALLLTATLGAAGCGVNEDLYNATVRDRDAEKQKLAATQTALDAEKAKRKKDDRRPRRADPGALQQAGVAGAGRLAPGDRARQPGR